MLYLWYSLFPGRVNPEAWHFFTTQQVNQGREYSRVLRLIFIGGFVTQAAFLLWMVFGGKAIALSRWAQQAAGQGALGNILFFIMLWLLLKAVVLPFTIYSSYFWQRRWGFATQTLGSWWIDYLKGSGLEIVISAVGVALLFWAFSRWPGAWWLAGAAFLSLWLVIQSYLWPVLVSPLFNRFEPVKDPAVIEMVDELSRKAHLPVDRVLVMDASKRTTKANAYFTGLGHTKRIVLYDNLLRDYPLEEVKAVVAHEMAHWRQGHIIKGLGMGIAANFFLWGFLFIMIKTTIPRTWHYPPYTLAVVLVFFLLVSFVSSPLQNYFSRQMETEADRVSVQLTEDIAAAVKLEVNLAAKNMSDVSPPYFIQWFSYTHPPALTRIKAIQQAGAH